MDMKENKVVNFIREHKKVITVGAVTIVGGIVAVALGKHVNLTTIAGATISESSKDIKVDGWDIGKLEMCWEESGFINAIVDDLTVADVGDLGKNLLKIDGVTPDTSLSVLLGVPNNMAK